MVNLRASATIRDLPEEILERILKGLRGRDILVSTLVCPEFNSLISKSSGCMTKIRIKSDGAEGIHKIDLMNDILTSSTRKYKHLAISNFDCFDGSFTSQIFQWETLTISSVKFLKGCYLMSFLSNFSRTLQILTLIDVRIVKLSKVQNKLVQFHRLHTFHCNTPKRLFTSKSSRNFDKNLLVDLLHYNSRNVKNLLLHISYIPVMYGITTNLKLRSLTVVCREYKYRLSDRQVTDGLKEFLTVQKDFLKELSLETLNNEILEFIYGNMKINKFTIGNGHINLKSSYLQLDNNSSIRFLRMEKDLSRKEIKKIIRATPELLQVNSRIFNVNMNEILGILIREVNVVDARLNDLDFPLEYIYYTGFHLLTFNLFEGKNTEVQDIVTRNERSFHRYMVNQLIQNGSSVFKEFFPEVATACEIPFCANLPLFHD